MARSGTLQKLVFTCIMLIKLSRSSRPSTVVCAVDGYDLYNLTTVNWFLNLDEQFCFSMNQSQHLSQCKLELAICHTIGGHGNCESSSVCSVSGNEYISLGTYRENPLDLLAPSSALEGFQAVFLNGSQYVTGSGAPCFLHTSMAFVCNKSVAWASTGGIESIQQAPVPKLVSYNNKTCQLSLLFEYAGACRVSVSPAAHMSPGTILIVVFIVFVILYFVFGAMINLARGYSGADVIPHGMFWTMLPIYIFDGFQFIFSCGRLPVISVYEQI